MEFIKTYNDNYQCNVYTLEGKNIILTIRRKHVYKNDEWQSIGDWKIIYHVKPYAHNLDGRSVFGTYKTLKESKKAAMNYITLFDKARWI